MRACARRTAASPMWACASATRSDLICAEIVRNRCYRCCVQTRRFRPALPGFQTPPIAALEMPAAARPVFPHRHLLGIEGLSPLDIKALLDLAEEQVEVSRQVEKKKSTLRGR